MFKESTVNDLKSISANNRNYKKALYPALTAQFRRQLDDDLEWLILYRNLRMCLPI